MLNEADVHATIAVHDLQGAEKFYGGVLGLEKLQENSEAILYRSGRSKVLVYRSEHAGTNRATAASWEVDDPKAAAGELRERGVVFEHYDDLPGTVREGDVHVMGPMQAAWFKDPDGNILCVGNTGT